MADVLMERLDDVAIVPGAVTTNPELVAPQFALGERTYEVPIFASAMDAVVSPTTAGLIHAQGCLAAINLKGLWFRYADPAQCFAAIAAAPARPLRMWSLSHGALCSP